jgi:YYY domain-containing protein
LYTLIYALCFYLSSLLVTIPFLKFFKFSEARFLSLLTISAISFAIGFVFPFKISFYIVFAVTIGVSLYTIYSDKVKVENTETVFALVFAFFIFLRFLNPYIQDAEKFMDSAFMNAVLKSSAFPPDDPFFAGGKLDFYYYFGHVISACITLMSFSPPEVGYNIAMSAIPAYTAVIIYGILRRKGMKVALSGIALSIFSGNAYSFVDFLRRVFAGKAIDGGYYWNATRVIADTINEFPYFSFIHADLHAHVVAIPIFTLIISLILRSWEEVEGKEYGRRTTLALALALFAIFATNSWDYPLAALACLLAALSLKKKEIVIALILSIPFVILLYSSMNTPAAKIFLVEDKTNAIEFLMYALTPLFFSYLFTGNRYTLYSLPLSIPLYFISPVLALTAPLAISSVYGIYKKDVASAIVLTGLMAFILPEFVAVESRLNTVFKFYIVAWLSLMIAPATKLEFGDVRKYVVVLVLVVSLVYPMAATPVRYNLRECTLDGMAFMKTFDGDYEAIKWLQGKSGVIIEEGCTHGALCGYKYGGRVSAFTGNPAVIAWTNHEFAWRRDYPIIAERANDVREFYTTSSCDEMLKIVSKYNISYVFFGYEEKRIFSVSPEKFERCFTKVFESRGTYIFATKNIS